MTAPELMLEHPDHEVLAAFIDDRLTKNEKEDVTRHLAACGECRTFVLEIHENIRLMAEEEGGNVVPMPSRNRGGWRRALAPVAVAAGLLVVFSGPIRDWVVGPVGRVERLYAGMPRPGEPRTSLDTEYKAKKAVKRAASGVDEERIPTPAEAALDEELAKLHGEKNPDPRALGLVYLLKGQPREAIPYLNNAAETDNDAKIDLAAALLLRGGKANAESALKLSEGSNDPRAVWNRALANYYLENYRAAKEDYEAYLRLDRSSRWSDQARTQLKGIDDLLKLQANPELRRP